MLRGAAAMLLLGGVLAPSSNTTGLLGPRSGDTDMGPVAVPLPVTADMLSYQSMALVAMVITIGASGGIGGGGVLVPVLMISENIGPHGAIPMSKLTIFGSAVCQLALNSRKRHMLDPKRPLIDYDTTLMLEPATLLGTVYGVVLNRMTPRWIIATLLMLFLAISTLRTLAKGCKLFKSESGLSPRSRGNMGRPDDSGSNESSELATSADAVERSNIRGAPPVPWRTVMQLLGVWCAVFAAALLRRTDTADCGSVLYWGVLVALTVFIAVLSRANGLNLLKRRQQDGYTFVQGDVKWDSENVIRVPILCVLAGVLAGLLGVGGGMVMQPLMLELGLPPDVCAATAAFMMLFTASSTTLQFTLNGMLDWERNIALPVIGVLGAAAGSLVIGRLVAHYNRLSLIVFPVAIIMAVSFFLVGYTTLHDLRLHGAGGFHGPCNDMNDAYNVSTPTPGRYNASAILDDVGQLDTLPDWQIVSVVVLVTSALFWHFYRYLSRQCKSIHQHDEARGEPISSTEESVDAYDGNNGVDNQGLDGSNVDKVPSRDSEAETTRLIGRV